MNCHEGAEHTGHRESKHGGANAIARGNGSRYLWRKALVLVWGIYLLEMIFDFATYNRHDRVPEGVRNLQVSTPLVTAMAVTILFTIPGHKSTGRYVIGAALIAGQVLLSFFCPIWW